MILLHICCAPCGSASLERLLRENQEVTLFFSNSNIFPIEEFQKRLFYAEKLARYFGIELLADSYEHERWLSRVKGLENEPEKGKRCTECFRFNLENSARKAEELGIEKYTTTLSISPHKNSSQIFESSPDSDSFKSVFAFKSRFTFS